MLCVRVLMVVQTMLSEKLQIYTESGHIILETFSLFTNLRPSADFSAVLNSQLIQVFRKF